MNALLISSTGCNLIFLSFGFSGAYLFCFFIAGYLKPLNPTPSITALDFKFLWAGNLLVYVNPFGSLSPQCFTYRKYSIKCWIALLFNVSVKCSSHWICIVYHFSLKGNVYSLLKKWESMENKKKKKKITCFATWRSLLNWTIYCFQQYIENIISIQKLRVSSSFGSLNQKNCFHLLIKKKSIYCQGYMWLDLSQRVVF